MKTIRLCAALALGLSIGGLAGCGGGGASAQQTAPASGNPGDSGLTVQQLQAKAQAAEADAARLEAQAGRAGPDQPAGGAVAGPRDPNNPLIGKWRFASVGARGSFAPAQTATGGCADEMVFTPTQQTLVFGDKSGTSDVHYIASATTIYVIGNGPLDDHVTYLVLDANHVTLDTGAVCVFVRAG